MRTRNIGSRPVKNLQGGQKIVAAARHNRDHTIVAQGVEGQVPLAGKEFVDGIEEWLLEGEIDIDARHGCERHDRD